MTFVSSTLCFGMWPKSLRLAVSLAILPFLAASASAEPTEIEGFKLGDLIAPVIAENNRSRARNAELNELARQSGQTTSTFDVPLNRSRWRISRSYGATIAESDGIRLTAGCDGRIVQIRRRMDVKGNSVQDIMKAAQSKYGVANVRLLDKNEYLWMIWGFNGNPTPQQTLEWGQSAMHAGGELILDINTKVPSSFWITVPESYAPRTALINWVDSNGIAELDKCLNQNVAAAKSAQRSTLDF